MPFCDFFSARKHDEITSLNKKIIKIEILSTNAIIWRALNWKGWACLFNVATGEPTICNTGFHPQSEAVCTKNLYWVKAKTTKQAVRKPLVYPNKDRLKWNQWSRDGVSNSGFSDHISCFHGSLPKTVEQTWNRRSFESLQKRLPTKGVDLTWPEKNHGPHTFIAKCWWSKIGTTHSRNKNHFEHYHNNVRGKGIHKQQITKTVGEFNCCVSPCW